MDIRKYNPIKDKKIVSEYLAGLENVDGVSFFHSKIQFDLLARYKNLFLALEKKVINIFYKDDKKSHVRFFFEYPMKDYDFLKDYDSVCVAVLSKSDKKDFVLSESVLDTRAVSLLLGKELRNVRKKVNRFRKEFDGFEVINFDKKKFDKEGLFAFFKKWGKLSESRKKEGPNVFLDRNLVDYIYSRGSDKVDGIIIRYKKKIIGVSFYFISPSGKVAIEFCSKVLTKYTGCSEFLKWATCKRLSDKNIGVMNMGASRDDKVSDFKKKFGGYKVDFYYVPIKNKLGNKDWVFWVGDQYFNG